MFSKGVKDYILLTGKKEFTFEEIEEMIESWAIPNFVGDMMRYSLFHLKSFNEHHDCYVLSEQELLTKGKDCSKDKITTFDIFHSFNYYLPLHAEYRLMDFYKTETLNLYYERVMAFDEWDTYYPIINKDTMQFPEQESKPEFYMNKKEDRNTTRYLSSFYIDQLEPTLRQGKTA